MEMFRTIRDGIFLLGLTVMMVAVFVGSAQGAFPGKPGPLVYPRVSFDESADVGGLVLHGPRQRQKPHQLTANSGDDTPSFSADGRFVAFAGNYEAGTPLPPGRHIYVVNVDGSGLRQLTHNKRDCFSGNCNLSPAWSPDGRHIAFLAVGRFSSDLEVMRADGRGEKEFSNGSTEEEGFGTTVGAPSWGPAAGT
jgi:hypothetical protein